ncbi:MAG TPA: tRNA-guanine transglycosylase, partial [Acidimicrobiia bacterium]|nr:tRNA-guanine transglycosylase [Acidimicrobiia bacterium]
VMGLGDAEGVLDAIARGADLFDCVWPTRLARHGRVLTADGDFNLRNARFADDTSPLHPECGCLSCRTYTRAYLRHLLTVKELAVHRLVTIHNLAYTLDLLLQAREAIAKAAYGDFRSAVVERRARGGW